MQVGIIGVKFTGKTTLFNVITGSSLATGQGGVEPHLAIGQVPDLRLDELSGRYQPKKTTPASVEWVDIPGFRGGVGAEGTREATRFLEHGRRVDALAQVIRCFDGGYGPVDPEGELETLALELGLADLQIVENRIERLTKEKHRGAKITSTQEQPMLERFARQLEDGKPLRDLELNPDEHKLVSGFSFLTLKPLIVVLNHAEGEELPTETVAAASRHGAEVVTLCASMEAELSELSLEEAREFLVDLGIGEPALARMIQAAYAALRLQSFFTVGPDECRAWTVCRGTLAPEAAGTIHTDMQRGFIRAEVTAYADLVACGTMASARQAGKVRLEGKNYQVQDGDIIEIRFNV